MMSVRFMSPLLQRSLSSCFLPKSVGRVCVKLNRFINFPVAPNFQQKRLFSAHPNPEGHTMNKTKKLGLYLICGGAFLVSLFYFVKNTERLNFSGAHASSSAQIVDENALTRYFELLERYPKLKREGDLNDHTKGAYEIIYDRGGILATRKEVYDRLYKKAKLQGLTDQQADEMATSFSRPGVVFEDQFWLVLRDVVVSPQGHRHTYNRHLKKSDLEGNGNGGAAALPIIVENGVKKIVLQLAFRHATNSWEMEIPRGNSNANETPMATAQREVEEETGYETSNVVSLGSIAPDTGLTASIIPVFLGTVTLEKRTKHDKTEAIKAKYAFTLAEIMTGLKRGYMEVEVNKKITQVPMRDPFLTYAVLMAQCDGHL